MAFEYFVVLAEMRTGSNLLESNLNAIEGVECHGELFNPVFINTSGTDTYHGVTLAQRDADPWALLNAVRAGGKRRVGFRLFHNHDPRIWQHVLTDPACAKIILTRNPLEAYVSRKIAAATNQWRLGNVMHRKQSKVAFDPSEFETLLTRLQQTQVEIQNTLQTTGQTAFYIGYDDVNDLEVLNGLARWLGVGARLNELPRTFKKQNPEPLEKKLSNPEDLAPGLARIDRFDLGRTPNFEVRRGPMLDACYAGAKTPLLFLPMRGAPETEVIRWLAALDGVGEKDLPRDFDHGRLSAWRQGNPGFRNFTVLRHPLKRAHSVFCAKVLTGQFREVREHMGRLFGVTLPDGPVTPSTDDHRAAFKAYLKFVGASVSGQTGLQPWPMWASQAALLDGFAQVTMPDALLREETLAEDLTWLARRVGHQNPPAFTPENPTGAVSLDQIVDDEIIALAQAAYRRDYAQFGFAAQ
jgi:hypothetical protein